MTETALTTRDRLLEAARELFASEGFHATTTPLISSRAGVAEGTIYRHFPSKQALLNAVYQDAMRWGTATVRAAAAGGGRVADRLGGLARSWLDAAEARPALVRLLFTWRPDQQLDEHSTEAAREFRAELEHLVAQGKQE
ncbi:MAG TPA: helix-turn-helix domain-containing protein, partial [Gemmatimonadales bacterium]|nr:helix-turn-helix domain-containing protein [Gemmatimonadales bacterium]